MGGLLAQLGAIVALMAPAPAPFGGPGVHQLRTLPDPQALGAVRKLLLAPAPLPPALRGYTCYIAAGSPCNTRSFAEPVLRLSSLPGEQP